eukprot:12279878-Ditylum_brightwellii.AAC.1
MAKRSNFERDNDNDLYMKHLGGNKRKSWGHETDRPDFKLHSLLNLDPAIEEDRRKFDCQAVIKQTMLKPHAARVRYTFKGRYHSVLPLHMTIMLGASTTVVDFLLSTYPISVVAKDGRGSTPLHVACEFGASLEVISLLLAKSPGAAIEKDGDYNTPLNIACKCHPNPEVISLLIHSNPDATREKNKEGMTPLHSACYYQASFEVLSLLLRTWPAAAKEKDNSGMTPLHNACEFEASLEVVSLLLDTYPAASKGNDGYGRTPLHSACWNNAPEGVLKLLLEECPGAVTTNDEYMGTLQDYEFENEQAAKLVSSVCCIIRDEINKQAAVEIMTYFIKTKWWGGVGIVATFHPAVFNVLGIDGKLFPYLLSKEKRPWKLLTIWGLISNMQDLLAS